MSYPSISRPFTAGGLTLSNRIVMPPMVIWMASEAATVVPAARAHYARSTGMGLAIVEATTVAPEGRLADTQLGIFEENHVPGLRSLAEAIHANGAKAAIQIHHAGRNTRSKGSYYGFPLVAPSAVNPGGETPRELTEDGIERIIGCFVTAARRARDAGFDAVELHAAHGYLISQFLSPLANHRTDRWGGSLENRARFLLEVWRRVRKETRGSIEAWCRLGAVDGAPGGLTLEEGLEVARWLKAEGVPLLHASQGIGDMPHVAPSGSPFSDRVHLAAMVKKAADIPVICVGDIRRPEEAEKIVSEGLSDLVAVGRGILADPSWARKVFEGRTDSIYFCHNCKRCHHFTDASRCPARLEAAKDSAKA